MYCNIDEAFGGNSNYIKTVLDNELNNEKLLERYKNFDNYFEKPKIIEHFNETPNIQSTNLKCSTIVDHMMRCKECRNNFIKKYIDSLLDEKYYEFEGRKIVTIVLIILLIIVIVKLIK